MSNLYTLIFRESSSRFERDITPMPGMWGQCAVRLAGIAIGGTTNQPLEVRMVWGSSAKCLDASTGNPADTIAVVQSFTAASIPAGSCHRLVPQGPTNVIISLHNPATGALITGVTSCVIQIEVRVDF